MCFTKRLDLQLFAEGGDGGAGAASGVGGESAAAAPAPGEQRLRELGVPEDVLRKRANRNKKRGSDQAAAVVAVQQNPTAPAVPAEPAPTEEPTTPAAKRMTWNEIMADPEYQKEMQRTLSKRLKADKGAAEKLQTLTPALELIARKYGQDPANLDYQALADAVNADDAYYEDVAQKLGVSAQRARELDDAQRNNARAIRQQQMTLEQQKMDEHAQKVLRQADEMKQYFPNFDLMKEMENPTFFRMTHPNVGISVKDAYYAIHHAEIQAASMQEATRKATELISNNIQAQQRRPNENGMSAQAPSVTSFDYRNASKAQREAFKKHIRDAAARGEKVYPGQIQFK